MNLNTGFDKKIAQFDNFGLPEFKKYLPLSEEDRKWGFSIHDVGYAITHANNEYPPKGHPSTHMFSWDNGRILNEYHIVLIINGKGIFESHSSGVQEVVANDGFLLFPREWHRYKPLNKIGWTEVWVGFSGPVADILMNTKFFTRKNPVVRNCESWVVRNLFSSLFNLVKDEPFGFQRIASGLCVQLIAEICNIQQGFGPSRKSNSLLSKAKYLMHLKIDRDIDLHLFCKENGISYSKFRSDFKHQTGFAPLQYFNLLKIEKGKGPISAYRSESQRDCLFTGF